MSDVPPILATPSAPATPPAGTTSGPPDSAAATPLAPLAGAPGSGSPPAQAPGAAPIVASGATGATVVALNTGGPTEKTWKAVQEQEAKLRKLKEELGAKEKDWETKSAQAKQWETAAQTLQKAEAEYQADPIAFLTSRGFTAEDLARRLLTQGTPSPDEAIRRAQEFANQAQTAAEKRAEEAMNKVQQLEQRLILKEYRAGLHTALMADKKRFGLLVPDPDRALDMAMNEAGLAAQAGTQLTNEEVLDRVLYRHVENLKSYTAHAEALDALRQLMPQGSSAPAQSSATPTIPNLSAGSGAYVPRPETSETADEYAARILARAEIYARQ